MKKLEIKHLAPYLPYGIGIEITTYNGKHISYSWGLKCCSEYLISEYNDGIKKGLTLTQVKPILRPLSDLTKEISNGVGLFYPYKELHLCYSDVTNFLNEDLWIGQWWDYEKVSKLFEWHFDVFGLIEKGLAIDINTLNQEL